MVGAPLRVGLVGANPDRGWAKDAHVPALKVLPRFQVVATSARTLDTAEAAAKAFGARFAFGDSLELVRSPEIDIVSVTVKVPEHLPIVIAALEAGKHIYCEWPLGRNVEEAEAMAAAAAKATGRVIIGLQGTGSPAIRRAAEIVKSGDLGRILSARFVSPTAGWAPQAPAVYEYLNDRKHGATMAAVAGGHTLAAVEMIVGRFEELQAQSTIKYPQVRIMGTDKVIDRNCADHLIVLGRHSGGCVSTVEIAGGRDPARTPVLFEILGEKGELCVNGVCAGGFQTGALTLETSLDLAPPPAPVGPSLKGPPANVAELYSQLATTIDTGRQHGFDFEEAAHLTRLLAAIDQAADSGVRQKL